MHPDDLPAHLARRLAEDRSARTAWRLPAPELNYGRHRMPPLPDTRPASVLLLLYPCRGTWTIPLTVRPRNLPTHAGQVCLPGGEMHTGETPEQAAWRECEEELGVAVERRADLGRLSPVLVYVSNFLITPCVAVTSSRPDFRPSSDEVADLLELPVNDLLDPVHHGVHWIRRGSIRFRAPHVLWQGHRIWGATRIILAELAAILGEPLDSSAVRLY